MRKKEVRIRAAKPPLCGKYEESFECLTTQSCSYLVFGTNEIIAHIEGFMVTKTAVCCELILCYNLPNLKPRIPLSPSIQRTPMNKISQQSTNLLLALAYLSIVVFFVNDIVYDFSGHEIDSYFVVELFNTALAMFVLFYQIRKIYVYKKTLHQTQDKLQALQGEMAQYIDNKLVSWELTKTEKIVCWESIKGYNPKEIAQHREVSQKTISKHLANIYAKSGTSSKQELLSLFLEDFMNL